LCPNISKKLLAHSRTVFEQRLSLRHRLDLNEPAPGTASSHHRDTVRAINDGVSAFGAKADVRCPEFRLLTDTVEKVF
jgi:hypothetical protein